MNIRLKKKMTVTDLLKVKKLTSYILLNFYYVLAEDLRIYRRLNFRILRRRLELEKDILWSKFRASLYKRLDNYIDMNKKVFNKYLEAHKLLKLKELDLNLVTDAYLQKIISNIYYCWKTIKLFSCYDYPYSIFFRGRKRFNCYEKDFVIILEILLISYDLNKLRRKIKKIMDRLSSKLSNYLRERYL